MEGSGVVITKSIFITVFIFIAVVGNASVLYAIRKYPKLKTVPNFFVFNLAIADLLFSTTGMPMILTTTVAEGWVLGDVMCDIGGLLNSVFCTTSIWTLVIISVHRYFAVSRAAQVKRMFNKRRTYLIIVCIWLFAFFVSMPPLFGWSRFVSGSNFCTVDGRDDMAYSMFLLLIDYFFPFFFLTVLYLRIFFLLRSHEKLMKKSCRKSSRYESDIGSEIITSDENEFRPSNECPSPNLFDTVTKIDNKVLGDLLKHKNNNDKLETKLTEPVTNVNMTKKNTFVGSKNNTRSRHVSFSSEQGYDVRKATGNTVKRRKSSSIKKFFKEVKVTKMLLIVVCGFFSCWTPFLIAAVLYAFDAVPTHLNLLTVGIMVACMNSIINPIIYAVMNQNFRSAFSAMFRNVFNLFRIRK